MTSTATHANRRPARSLAAVGCPWVANGSAMYADAKQPRLGGRMRVPR